jgi:hypothetical protein
LIWRRPGVSAKMAPAIDLRKRPRLFAPALGFHENGDGYFRQNGDRYFLENEAGCFLENGDRC